MAGSTETRIVVTGIGVVSPVGIGKDAFWSSLLQGRSGIDFVRAIPTDGLPSKLAAEIRNFDPDAYVLQRKFLKVMAREIQLGVAAASLAMKDSGLVPGDVDPLRLGVEFGAGRIAITPDELRDAALDFYQKWQQDRSAVWSWQELSKIAPLWLLKRLPNMPACHVSIEHNAQGPNNTITSRDASALLALAEGMSCIQRGVADVMIVGACSSRVHPVDIARMNVLERLSRRDDAPSRACRPFDRDRDGAIVGEGAATFIIESYDHAVARGADIYAEIMGVASGCDGRLTDVESDGRGLVVAMKNALRQAQITPDQIGHLNAHATSSPWEDLVEARAYRAALGSYADRIPVVALKSFFGTFDAGSGAVELAGSLLALRHSQLPFTLNYETPDPDCRLNVVRDQPARLRNSVAMSVNRTAMGQSAAVVLRAV